jgi:cation diffusion facilitator CzcD-associated flavoprotein CzcO
MVVGAGISGIGSAVHLQEQCPGKSFVILEKFESFGGTWHMHRYPGIRSDSDLYTFGYRFKPWVGPPIATAAEIKKYMGEVIEEHDLARHIRYRHRITSASWSSERNVWTVRVSRLDEGDEITLTCNFLYMCQGYYNQDKGYMPEWPGMSSYRGRVIHPMEWTEDTDYTDKNILVIGSGATAATVVPEFCKKARHVTVLQRSPTYFIPGRNADDLADTLRQPAGGSEGSPPGGLRHEALHPLVPSVAAAHRLRARRGPLRGHPRGEDHHGHRRDRHFHRDRRGHEGRHRHRGRHRGARHRLQPERARGHPVRGGRQAGQLA